MTHDIQTYNIKKLFTTDNYRIPIYQRNYAWGKAEISQLLQDIIDYIPAQRNYYIGTLVVYERTKNGKIFYDTIDGQQRLTTLSIILSVLQNQYGSIDWFKENILSFESRPLSQNALDFSCVGHFSAAKEYHNTISEAYEHITLELKNKLKENNISMEGFASYLTDYVTILRVEVPHDTDLNHYFEIMNNRGEQLEKHEVVKSLLLDVLYDESQDHNDDLQELFHIIWDAVSSAERYVQFGFEPKLRKLFFSEDWSTFEVQSSQELREAFYIYKSKAKKVDAVKKLSIDGIINNQAILGIGNDDPEAPDRFTSPINFQNFLLHILRIQTKSADVVLDDKRLIDFFKKELKKNEKGAKEFALEFMFQLLNGKYLLDKYVIKRQILANKEGWTLLKLKSKEGSKGFYKNTFRGDNWENEIIVTLLSMFHVSTPTMIYKHWLNAVLYYLINEEEIIYENYKTFLENIAKDLLCYRFLNNKPNSKLDYFSLIYERENISQNYPIIRYDNPLLNYGCIENNLVFNFLDYIIWINEEADIYNDFEFSFRSSVEHYYPQNPIGGKKLESLDSLHSFGNLCLISHQKNSKLNHHLPSAKKNYYSKLESGGQLAYDSLKQYVMMTNYDVDTWGEVDIFDHHKKMVDLINSFIQNT